MFGGKSIHLALLALLLTHVSATPVPDVEAVGQPAHEARADVDKDYSYFSFKRDEGKRADIDKDYSYFSFKRDEGKRADIDKDYSYFSFKRDGEEKRADIDKDYSYFSFKRDQEEKREAEAESKRAPWDGELDYSSYDF